MKILFTGFTPFGGDTVNPSWDVLQDEPFNIPGVEIACRRLPVSFRRAVPLLEQYIDIEKPDMVIALGQAGGINGLRIERIGINLLDARIPDNDGYQPVDLAAAEGSAPAYFSTVPVKRMAEAVIAEGIPCDVSYSAGTFVCNQVLYGILHYASVRNLTLTGGFIHIPYSLEQAAQKKGSPGMSGRDVRRGLKAAIKACLAEEESTAAGKKEIFGTLY